MKTKSSKHDFFASCQDCKGRIIYIPKRGERVCSDCGLISDERGIAIGNYDVRTFTNEDKIKKDRTGTPISELLPDIGLCTVINTNYIHNSDFKRIVKRDTQLSWKSRNFLIASNEIKRIAHNLHLPKYLQKATLNLYRKTFEASLLRGRSIKCMISACIYYICKENELPRTFQEIIRESTGSRNIIKKCYKSLIKDLNLKSSAINPVAFIPRYIVELGLERKEESLAIRILQLYLSRSSMRGIDPMGLCAGAIYFMSKLKELNISQKRIVKVVGTTEVTLRARYNELRKTFHLF